MTRVFFARHGESVWHAENRYAGTTDVGMTKRGFEQAGRLSEWAATAGLAAVYSSGSSRARDTAAPAALAINASVQIDPRFREVGFGEGEGLTRTEMAERFPDALAAFIDRPASIPLPGGEPGMSAIERFVAGLAEVAVSHPAGRVLIVSHSTVIRLVMSRLLGINPDRYRQVFPVLGNATITEVIYESANAGLLRYNQPID